MNIVKYQLAVWLKNSVATLPGNGIDAVPDATVTYEWDTPLTARIKVVRERALMDNVTYYDFKLSEVRSN